MPLKDLLKRVYMGDRTPDTLSSLANRPARLGRDLTQEEHARIERAAGRSLTKITRNLLQATDQDRIEAEARRRFDILPQDEPSPEPAQQAAAELARAAAGVFTGPVNELIEGIRRERGPVLDHVNLDELEPAGWSGEAERNAARLREDFAAYLREHKDEIPALRIFFDQP